MTHPDESTPTAKLSLGTMTAMVVGSMVGAGVFSLPRNFAQATGIFGALVAWVIAGGGMLMLAFVFQRLAVRKPELDAGVYAYAKAGFGDYVGFNSAFGYWASSCVGNVTYWVLIKSTLGAIFPRLGEGNTALAAFLSSIGVWIFHYLVSRGVKEAATINRIVTVAKLLPILTFLVIAAIAMKADVLRANFWGGASASFGGVFEQVKSTMLITVFVFIGIEGASVYSRHAKRREDVGRATVLGFLGVLAVFSLVTLLSYGVAPRAELGAMREPSMAGVLESIVGPWGKVFISAGVIVSVLGAYLAWTLMAAEVLYVPATKDDMPRFLARRSARDVPIASLVATSGLIQVFVVVTLFSEDAFGFMLNLTSALSLVPYFLAAAFALKVAVADRTPKHVVIAGLATAYTAFLVVAAGPKFLLLSCIIYSIGTVLYVIARREQHKKVFRPIEAGLFGALTVGAIAGIAALASGRISI